MNHNSFIKMVVVMTISGLFAGCGGVPERDHILRDARTAYAEAQANPNTANVEALYEAKQTLEKAEAAENAEEMRKLGYLAQRQAERAVTVGERKAAEAERANLVKEKDKVLLEAREKELVAQKLEAAAKALEAKKAQEQAELAQQQLAAEQAKLAAEQAKLAAEQAKIQRLQDQLSELEGQQTERGLVLTLGDVLFGTGKAQLAAAAMRNIDTVASFLNENPERNVLVEGHTDDRGKESYNLDLSQRRADSVRYALIDRGVDSHRILARGLGENQPIADNSTATGRQQNRRVEITILNEGEGLYY